jgi:branched-chain amino acid transport system substrate-binding protein
MSKLSRAQIVGAIVAIVVIVVGVWYWQSHKAGGPGGALMIATAGPMTGEYAAFGEQMKHGAQRPVEEINAKCDVLVQQL